MEPIKTCRACGDTELFEFLDLGQQYLSDFREDNSKPPRHPLVAVLCESCKLVQLKHTTPQELMYHENYGFKSGVSDSIIIDLDSIVTHAFQYCHNPQTWLDIGCNDGTLLSFVPRDVYRVGVDPITFLCVEAEASADLIINDFFSSDIGGEYDVISTVSCFYDMPDPSRFVADVNEVLADKGVWIIQQNYLLTTLELSAVDNFCHEHLEYYTLLSLENLLNRFGLEVNEVYLSMVNGGSIRTIVSRKGDYPVDESVYRQRLVEQRFGLDTHQPYEEFAVSIMDKLNKLRRLVLDLKLDRKRIAILAASTRGAVIWQAADLGPEEIDYAVERNPAKVGKNFSAIGIPIISEAEAHKRKPDYMVVGPWFFAREIENRELEYIQEGGALIFPLPEVVVVDMNNLSQRYE